MMNQQNFEVADWSRIPAPIDDGSADHLRDMSMPEVRLPSTDGGCVDLAHLTGWSVALLLPDDRSPGRTVARRLG